MRSKNIITLAVFVIVALGVGAYFYRQSRPVVEVYAARRGTATYAVYGTIKVVPDRTFAMHAQSSGILKYSPRLAPITNLPGIEIKSGEVLGQIVDESLDRDFGKARVELLAAQDKQKLGPPGIPALKTQEALVARLQKLVALSNVPPSEVEHAVNDLTTDQELVRQQEIEIERSLKVAQQEFDNLQKQEELCKFTSPFDGTINAVNNENGEYVKEGAQPFVLVTTNLYLEGQINEEDVGRVARGMKAAVKLYAYAGQNFSATVTLILPAPNNQRYTVDLDFERPPGNLLAGETGEMNIISATREHALLVPARAVLTDRVWVAQDGMVKPRTVKVGLRNLEQAEILDGLSEGETVVVADQDLLRTGETVRVVILN